MKRKNNRIGKAIGRIERAERLTVVDEEELNQFMFTVEQAQKAEMYAAKRENRAGRDIEIYQTLGWRYKEHPVS